MKISAKKSLAEIASRSAGIAFALDIVVIIFSALFATYLRARFDSSFIESPGLLALRLTIYSTIWVGGLHLRSAWARSNFLPGKDSLVNVASASWRVAVLIFAILYLIKLPISRIWVGTMLVTTSICLTVGRLVYQEHLKSQFALHVVRRVLVICTHEDFSSTKNELENFSDNYNYEFYRISPPVKQNSKNWIDKTRKVLRGKNIDTVVIGFGAIKDSANFVALTDDAREQVLDVYLVSRVAPIISRLNRTQSLSLLQIREPRILDSGRFIKRTLDIFLGTALFIFSIPFLLFAAIGIKLSSRGPVLYTDKRVGKSGNPFVFPKFRTMYTGSSETRLKVLGRPDSHMPIRYQNDPRITPFGKLLRRWSIDELPQLWCVIIGTMSLVGPRPILFQEIPQVLTSHQTRFIAKPGLTGLWQISGRKLTSWEERMAGDIAYIQNWSLANDIALIFRTVGVVITGKGSL